MQRRKVLAALRSGVEAAHLHLHVADSEPAPHLRADEILEARVGEIDVYLGLNVAWWAIRRMADLVHPLVQTIERDGGLSGGRAKGKEAVQVIAGFLERELPL